MPHFIVEYSANLEERTDIKAFCRVVKDAALATGFFEIGAVRVRAFRADTYVIADELEENAYLGTTLRMGYGRSREDRKKIGDAIFAAMTSQLAPLFDTPHFALSFDIEEIDKDLTWKKNAMHARLRGKI